MLCHNRNNGKLQIASEEYGTHKVNKKRQFCWTTYHVGLGGKLASQSLVVLLTHHLLLQGLVATRHQLTHLRPFVCDILEGSKVRVSK